MLDVVDPLQQRAFGLFSAALREGLADRPDVYRQALEDARALAAALSAVDAADLDGFAARLAGYGVDAPVRAPILAFVANGLETLGLAARLPPEVAALGARTRDDVVREFAARVAAFGGEEIADRRRFDHTPVVEVRAIDAAVAQRRTATLLVIAGRQMGTMYKLQDGETIVGRGDDAQVRVDDDGVSRKHAALRAEGDTVRVADLGSTNGVLVNGARVAADRPLEDGDRIQIGATTILKFSYQDALEEHFQSELYKSVTLDPLTGVANRKVVLDRLRAECSYGARVGSAVAVLMVDVDKFKSVNDTYGHPAGDAVLRSTAQVVHKTLRSEDIVGRYGGEELCVVLRGIDQANAELVAERIRKLVADNVVPYGEQQLKVTVSIGVASFVPESPAASERLIEAADQQLYRAKEGGRNRVMPA